MAFGLAGQDLALAFPGRYLEAVAQASFPATAGAAPSISPSYDVFTGEYPYGVRFSPGQLALYTGMPLYSPAVVTLGSVTQAGWYDDYSTRTPLAFLVAGYQSRLGFLAGDEGPFAGWGARWDFLHGALFYNFGAQALSAGLGLEFKPLSLELTIPDWNISQNPYPDFEAALRLRIAVPWGLSLGFSSAKGGRFSLGLGTELFRPASDAVARASWSGEIAHRGSLQRAPENTEPAIRTAFADGDVAGVEVDVQRTLDGHYVLVHDPILIRYQYDLALVGRLTLSQIKQRDFGSWFSPRFKGTRILTLEELGQLRLARPDLMWILDLKDVALSDEDAQAFLAAVRTGFGPNPPLILATGDQGALRRLKEKGEFPVGLQIDVTRFMFLVGDFVPPVFPAEIAGLVDKSDADFFFILSSRFDRIDELSALSKKLDKPFFLWNFHDRMYGEMPDGRPLSALVGWPASRLASTDLRDMY